MNGLTIKSKSNFSNNCINLMINSFISKKRKGAQPFPSCKIERLKITFIELF